ncbi:hypothetical protein BJ170DRAFT_330141 [Xylariales sp. AK1849]|nr:hypothetical protein BJ170DRAFT_330141 [Xylariales sp. AK1849]
MLLCLLACLAVCQSVEVEIVETSPSATRCSALSKPSRPASQPAEPAAMEMGLDLAACPAMPCPAMPCPARFPLQSPPDSAELLTLAGQVQWALRCCVPSPRNAEEMRVVPVSPLTSRRQPREILSSSSALHAAYLRNTKFTGIFSAVRDFKIPQAQFRLLQVAVRALNPPYLRYLLTYSQTSKQPLRLVN